MVNQLMEKTNNDSFKLLKCENVLLKSYFPDNELIIFVF